MSGKVTCGQQVSCCIEAAWLPSLLSFPDADDQAKPSVGDKRPHSDMSADNVTTMLSVTKQLEDIYVSQRVEDLDKLASGNVTLHKDSITLAADIQGIDNLKKYYQVRWISCTIC